MSAAIHYRTQQVGDVEVFYREAGPIDAPVLLLLHGFPTASHMFRDLLSLLSDRIRLIAPDLPGFGQTRTPARGKFNHSFDAMAQVVEGFVDAIGLDRFALYIFDYGAPTGLRLAAKHPERTTAIISRTVTPMRMASAMNGARGRHIGAIPTTPIVRHAALRFRRKRSATGNTEPARTRAARP